MRKPPTFRFGPFEVQVETGELRKNGQKVRLQEKPFQVLVALLEQRGRLVSRETLRQRLWSSSTFVDFDNGLNTAVSKLRDALADPAETHGYIETLARRGYRFVAPLDESGILKPERKGLRVQLKYIDPEVLVVEIVGRIVLGPECGQIERLISDLLSKNKKKIVFDISGVDYIDSTGVGILVMCVGTLKNAGGQLRLAGARGTVEMILEMTKVNQIVALYPTTAAAVRGFTGQQQQAG